MTTDNADHATASPARTVGRRTAPVRYLIVGVVILMIAVLHLITTVQDWSTAPSSGFLGAHALQLGGIVVGVALVVTGIVKAVRR